MDELLKPFLDMYGAQLTLAGQLCGLFFVVFSVALIFWTWRDADRRGAMSWFWAIVVLIFNLAGWAIYMVMRPPEYIDDVHERELEIQQKEAELAREGARCPSCLKTVDPDMLICPYCMKKLKKQCVQCNRALKMSWSVCPYCKTKQQVRGAEAESATARPRRGHAPSGTGHSRPEPSSRSRGPLEPPSDVAPPPPAPPAEPAKPDAPEGTPPA